MKVRLRAITSSDLSLTLKWHNSERIQEMYSGHPFPVNEEMEKLWYDRILTSNYPTTVLMVEHIEDCSSIGLFILKNISLLHRNAELALYIGEEEYLGQGLSREILMHGLHFGFDKLGLHRIELRVQVDNEIAIALYKEFGFKQEGLLRDVMYKKGAYIDEYIMAILKEEFNV